MLPVEATNPTQVMLEQMRVRGWDLQALSQHSGLTFQELSRPWEMTERMAQGLASAFGTAPEFWLRLQGNYDAWKKQDDFLRSHTLAAVMARGELTEEEAYFILRFAGKLGYTKAIHRLSNPWRTLRKWFVWIGGWENGELGQWDQGKPAWEPFRRGKLQNPTPISFFGHRITIQSRWLRVQIGRGYLNILFPNYVKTRYGRIYWSPNGTPQHPQARFFLGRRPTD